MWKYIFRPWISEYGKTQCFLLPTKTFLKNLGHLPPLKYIGIWLGTEIVPSFFRKRLFLETPLKWKQIQDILSESHWFTGNLDGYLIWDFFSLFHDNKELKETSWTWKTVIFVLEDGMLSFQRVADSLWNPNNVLLKLLKQMRLHS